jgi:ketosteroid isomerase-like protein
MTSMSPDFSAQLATTQRLVVALARHDIEATRACFTEDFVFHVPGDSRVSGDRHGWNEYLELLGLARNLSHSTFRSETLDLLVGKHRIIVLQRETAERDGKRLDHKAFYLLDFDGDLIASVRAAYEDQALLREFWGSR